MTLRLTYIFCIITVLWLLFDRQIQAQRSNKVPQRPNQLRDFKRKGGQKLNETRITTSRKPPPQPSKPPKIEEKNVITSKNDTIIVQLSSVATLDCKIRDLKENQNVSVIWRKVDNDLTITNNKYTILKSDKRYQVVNSTEINDWSLRVRLTKQSDEGLYECRVKMTGENITSIFVNLTIIRAYVEITVSPIKFKFGLPLRIICVLKHSIEPPLYIFWYKEDRVINYDLDDGATVREGRQGSELIFPRAEAKHTGNYSCVPSNADQASVHIEVQQSSS